MDHRGESERANAVRDMFSRIAARYDLMNRIVTGGQDIRWRRQVIRKAQLRLGSRLLDIGTGTGDLASEARKQIPDIRVAAADFTVGMMRVGQEKGRHDFTAADALRLPFPDGTFDGVVCGFLLRNVVGRAQALREQRRVLKSGGRIVILDTTRPQRSLVSPLVSFHMHVVIPALGGLLTADGDAYRYLPESTENFMTAEELADLMREAGFRQVEYRRMMFGTVAIHWGLK